MKTSRRQFIRKGALFVPAFNIFVPKLLAVPPSRAPLRVPAAAAAGGGGGGTVAFDARTTQLQLVAGTGTSTTFAHVVTGSGPGILVWVILTGTAQTVSSVTYGGQALSLIGSKNGTIATICRLELWGLTACPTGSNNVVVTLSAANSAWDVISDSFTGVAAAGAFDGFQSTENTTGTATLTVTVTTGDTGDMVADATASTADNGTTSGAGQTQRWQDNSGATNTQGSTKAGGASVAMSETWDGPDTCHLLAAVNINHN